MTEDPAPDGRCTALAFAAVGLPLSATAGALLYGTLLGLASGANAATNSIVWPDYFGVEALGAVKGVVNAVRNGATALGPPLAAVLVATSGFFTSSLVAFGATAGAGASFSVFLRKPSGPGVDAGLLPAASGASSSGAGPNRAA